jgi:hypothetical protein
MSCQDDEGDVVSHHVLTGMAIDAWDVGSPLPLLFAPPGRRDFLISLLSMWISWNFFLKPRFPKTSPDYQISPMYVDDEDFLPGSYMSYVCLAVGHGSYDNSLQVVA